MAQNVKVAIRVRNVPKWFGRDGSKDNEDYQTPIVVVDNLNPQTKINQHLVIGSEALQKEKREFTYDYVFSPTDDQAQLYDSLIAPLISKCVQGFNGCVFVYGQTASGKTYTMGGPAVQNPNDRGIILRVAEHLTDYIDKNGRKDLGKAGYDFTVTGSYLEIYNEQLKDLLGKNNEELKIRLDPTSLSGKDVYVQGLTQVPLVTDKDYIKAIETGVSKRRVAETNMNAVSSRSHSILTLTITQREFLEGGKEGIKRRSKIHLIDLAGSERAESTGATGAVLKEGAAINQSLSCLGNVINALSTGSNHVPYRDSKLTHLLSDSLGGNSLTILVACLTPIAGAYEETVSTLKFAERVKKIKNKAVLNVDANTLRIMALEAENAELKEKLAKCSCGKATQVGGGGEQSTALKEKLALKLKAIFKGMEAEAPEVTKTIAKTADEDVKVRRQSTVAPVVAPERPPEHASATAKPSKLTDAVNLWRKKGTVKVEPIAEAEDKDDQGEPTKTVNSLGIRVIMQPDPSTATHNAPQAPADSIIIPAHSMPQIMEQQQELVELKSKKASLSQEFRDLEILIEQEDAKRIQMLSEAADGPDAEYKRLRDEYGEKNRVLLEEKEIIEKELQNVKELLQQKEETQVSIPISASNLGDSSFPVMESGQPTQKIVHLPTGIPVIPIVTPESPSVTIESQAVAQVTTDDQQQQKADDEMTQYYQQMLHQALDMPSTTQQFLENPNVPNNLSDYKSFMKHTMEVDSDADEDSSEYFGFQKVRNEKEIVLYKWLIFVAGIFGLGIGIGVGWAVSKTIGPSVSSDSTANATRPSSSNTSAIAGSSSSNQPPPVLTSLTLIAGSSSARGSLDGPGPSSKFSHIRGAAVNASGHVFIVDEINQNIRLLSPPTQTSSVWTVSTFSGSTTQEYGLRNGPSQTALFSYPRDVFVDNVGTVWVADCGNSLVRTISQGTVNTFYNTGGCPVGIAVSPKTGHVYIADSEANLIYHLLPSGQVASIIGTGEHGSRDGIGATATFSTVNHFAMDYNGDYLFISDCGKCKTTSNNPGDSNLIRKLDLVSERVSTMAGRNGPNTFCGPNYIAVSPTTGNLLVAQDCSPPLASSDDLPAQNLMYVEVSDGGKVGVFASNNELLPSFGAAFNIGGQSAIICSDSAVYLVTK